MFQLRDYQKQAVSAGIQFLQKGKGGGLLVLPTGSGKSIVIAEIAKELGKTLVLQPSKEILEQNYSKMVSYVGSHEIGIYSASAGRKDIGRITFATIGSIINKKELFQEFDNIIIDEAHLVNSKGGMYETLINALGVPVLGLTATPYRLYAYCDMYTGEKSVVAKFLHRTRPRIFTEVIHVTQIQDLYERGFLCPVSYYQNAEYDYGKIRLNSTGMDFDESALFKYNQEANVVGKTEDYILNSKAKHILVFSASVDEAQELSRNLNSMGMPAVTVSAKTPKSERENIITAFRDGYIKVVTNVGVFTTGFDFPELDCVVLSRPTQSVALYYQMCGRGIRIAPGKEKVTIADMCGNVSRFGKIETFEIIEPKAKLHRLKSNASFLTGYDFVNEKDLEAMGYRGKKEFEGNGFQRSMTTVNFGKYKGKLLKDVPTDYLKWIVKEFDDGYVKTEFQKEINRRSV